MFDENLFATRIRELRVQRGISQAELGAVLGMTKPAISDLERGRRTTTIEKIAQLADYFNVTLDYLTGKSDTSLMPVNDWLEVAPENLKEAFWDGVKEVFAKKSFVDMLQGALKENSGIKEADIQKITPEFAADFVADVLKNDPKTKGLHPESLNLLSLLVESVEFIPPDRLVVRYHFDPTRR